MKIYTRCVYAWRPDGSPVLEEADSFDYEGPVTLAKSSPSAPPAPDYAAAATAQGVANTETARVQGRMNNPNVNNPYGSQTVTWGGGHQAEYDAAKAAFAAGTGGDPGTIEQFNTNFPNADQATITQTLNPQSQAAFNQQQQVQLALAQLANQGVGNVRNVLGSGFEYQGPGIQTSLTNPGGLQMQVADAGPIQAGPQADTYGLASGGVNAPSLQMQLDNAGVPQMPTQGGVQSNIGYNAPIQSNVGYGTPAENYINTAGVPGMPVNPGMTAQNAIMSRLQPQIERERSQLETQLRNQGLVAGGEAYGNSMTIQNQRENDLLAQAASQGVGLDLSANQQGFGQAQAKGQFTNQAQQQQYLQALQNAQLANQAQSQGFGQALTKGQFGNQAQNQMFTQGLAANQQGFQQAVQSGQFGNEAQLASFGANLQNQQALNQAIAQNFGQGMNATQLQNAQQNQRYGQNLSNAQFANSAVGQQFNQNLAAGQFANQAQQQGYGQQLTERNLPLNEISALMSGSQIQNPQFQQYQGAQVAPTPIFNAAQQQAQYNQGLYGAQVGQANSFNSGLMSMGGAIGSAFII